MPFFSSIRSARTVYRTAFAAALAAALATLAYAPGAAACDCVPRSFALPSTSSAKVPSNTKIWLLEPGCQNPMLQEVGGAPVTTTTTTIGQTMVLHPDAPLEVGSTYEVTGCFGDDMQVTTFTVTEGPDTEPPPAPSFSVLNRESGSGGLSSCGEYEYAPLLVDQTDVLLTLDIAGRSTLDPKTLSGTVADVFFPTDGPVVGSQTCGANNWDFDTDGEALDVRLRAFDLAGNSSDWSAPQNVEAGCGCEAAGADPSHARGYGLFSTALLALTLLGRRRAKPSSR